MADNKNSFVLYCDIIHTVGKLSDEQAGLLFKHILSYVNDENPVTDNIIIELVFEPIKQQLKRDLKRYEAICKRNIANGKLGGRPKNKPKKPTGLKLTQVNPEEPKKADNDHDNDSDIKKEIIKEKIIVESHPYYNDFLIYLNWLNSTGFNVKKLEKQLTIDEYAILVKKYGIPNLNDILTKMNNYKPLAQKNISVYLTANNWLTRELKTV